MSLWLLIPGIGSLVLAIYQFLRTTTFINSSLRSTGTIISQEKGFGAAAPEGVEAYFREDYFRYVVQFKTEDGSYIKFKSRYMGSVKVYSAVNIRYDPRNPKRAKIDSWGQLWGLTLIYGLIGAIFIAISLSVR